MAVRRLSYLEASSPVKVFHKEEPFISHLPPKYFTSNAIISPQSIRIESVERAFQNNESVEHSGWKWNTKRGGLWRGQKEGIPIRGVRYRGKESSRSLLVVAKGDLEGETVVVVGLGKSGRAAARLALARGAERVVGMDTNISTSPLEDDPSFANIDKARLKTELGPHRTEIFREASRIVLSPGVPAAQPDIARARKEGVLAISELAFAAEVLPRGIKIAAVSGTNGKSTVTSFTGQILRAAGLSVFVGGNLGTPLSEAALFCLERPEIEPPYQAAVVEVSSYQMELPGSFHPKAAVIINLSVDHQERHGSMEAYGEAKCRMFQHMDPSDVAIIPQEDSLLRKLASKAGGRGTRGWLGGIPGVQLDSQARRAIAVVPTTGEEARLFLSGLKAVGRHNANNASIASLLSLSLDVGVHESLLQETIPTLEALPHRMQIVKEDKNILFLNDSKATNVDATLAALEGLIGRKAVVLLGGVAKTVVGSMDLGFGRLLKSLSRHRAVITFGASGEDIANELERGGLGIPLDRKLTMEEAVGAANSYAVSGDVILLSPGCASFDEFSNFEHRGRVFAELVNS